MRRVTSVVVLVLVLCGCEVEEGPPKRTSNDDLLPCLPADGEIRGLTLAVEPKRISRDGLAGHVSGEAGIYLSYGFDHLVTARYTNTLSSADPEQRFIQLDVFRMRDAYAAFGAYTYQSHVLEGPARDIALGAGARLGALSGHLWKADCYVKVESADRSADGRSMVRRILERVTRHIVGDSPKPTSVRAVPPTLPGADRPRVFVDKVTLGNIHWLSDDDILALEPGTQGAVIETVDNALFFVVLYPDTGAAARGWSSYRKFLDDRGANEEGAFVVAKFKDGTHTAAFARGAIVAGIWNASSARSATGLAAKALAHIRGLAGDAPPAPATHQAPAPGTATTP